MLRTYTLSEIRNGTGWPKDARFAEVIDARLELEGNPVFTELRKQRDALLEALETLVVFADARRTSRVDPHPTLESARAAIAQAKRETA